MTYRSDVKPCGTKAQLWETSRTSSREYLPVVGNKIPNIDLQCSAHTYNEGLGRKLHYKAGDGDVLRVWTHYCGAWRSSRGKFLFSQFRMNASEAPVAESTGCKMIPSLGAGMAVKVIQIWRWTQNTQHPPTHKPEPFLRSRQLCSYSRNSQDFTEPAGSLPCSQEPYAGLCPGPDKSNPLRSILILSTHLRLGLPWGIFPSDFPANILHIHIWIPLLPHSCYMSYIHNTTTVKYGAN
jgi:hypothetical protein